MSSAVARVEIPTSLGPRTVTVYRPADAAKAPLPLLVLHDGQNLFEPERAHMPGQHWRVAEAAEELIAAGKIPLLVICGIDHGGDQRGYEFTPTAGDRAFAGPVAERGIGGGVAEYGRMVMDEIVPWLVREHGARAGAEGIAMGGSSLGGLATIAIARQFPGRISRLLVMSPSVWWDRRVILRRLARVGLSFPPTRPRVYLDIGRREGAQSVVDTRALRDVLIPQTSELRYVEDPNGQHTEADWSRRLPDALTWLYA